MNKAEAKRWAYYTAAEFARHGWDACDWSEKGGPDAALLYDAMAEVVVMLSLKGPRPRDRAPRIAAAEARAPEEK